MTFPHFFIAVWNKLFAIKFDEWLRKTERPDFHRSIEKIEAYLSLVETFVAVYLPNKKISRLSLNHANDGRFLINCFQASLNNCFSGEVFLFHLIFFISASPHAAVKIIRVATSFRTETLPVQAKHTVSALIPSPFPPWTLITTHTLHLKRRLSTIPNFL